MDQLLNKTYVVFDLETTGLDPKDGNSIIEIGAVRVKDNQIIDRFDELINPNITLSDEITRITNITNEMLVGKPTEEVIIKKFIEWIKDDILVAHNANFDLSFIKMAYLKYNLGKFNFDVIDTLGISRFLEPYERYHNLTVLMNRYKINWDEKKHHRADYDSEGTSLIFFEMLNKLEKRGIVILADLSRKPQIVLNKRV
jgi:exonuclease, DNA polymerase III, epsilon subunit family